GTDPPRRGRPDLSRTCAKKQNAPRGVLFFGEWLYQNVIVRPGSSAVSTAARSTLSEGSGTSSIVALPLMGGESYEEASAGWASRSVSVCRSGRACAVRPEDSSAKAANGRRSIFMEPRSANGSANVM